MSHLTPADVHNVAFKKPSLGKRGYDEEEVDTFLDAVERTIAALKARDPALRPTGAVGRPRRLPARFGAFNYRSDFDRGLSFH